MFVAGWSLGLQYPIARFDPLEELVNQKSPYASPLKAAVARRRIGNTVTEYRGEDVIIKEFMKEHSGIACVNLNGLLIGLSDQDEEPFYFHKKEGPFCFGLAYNTVQREILKEMMPSHVSEERIPKK
jgi:hypothetical protein